MKLAGLVAVVAIAVAAGIAYWLVSREDTDEQLANALRSRTSAWASECVRLSQTRYRCVLTRVPGSFGDLERIRYDVALSAKRCYIAVYAGGYYGSPAPATRKGCL